MDSYLEGMTLSAKYEDEVYEYVHVKLSKEHCRKIKNVGILTKIEQERLQIYLPEGWQHYTYFYGDQSFILLRRLKGIDPKTGIPPPDAPKILEKYENAQKENLKKKNP